MIASVTNDEMVQKLVDKINELEEENKELTKERLVDDPVCQKAVEAFGKDYEIIVAIEEMAELMQALTKVLRGKPNFENVDEETADVGISMKMLKIIFNNHKRVAVWNRRKIHRLRRRIANGIDDDSRG